MSPAVEQQFCLPGDPVLGPRRLQASGVQECDDAEPGEALRRLWADGRFQRGSRKAARLHRHRRFHVCKRWAARGPLPEHGSASLATGTCTLDHVQFVHV